MYHTGSVEQEMYFYSKLDDQLLLLSLRSPNNHEFYHKACHIDSSRQHPTKIITIKTGNLSLFKFISSASNNSQIENTTKSPNELSTRLSENNSTLVQKSYTTTKSTSTMVRLSSQTNPIRLFCSLLIVFIITITSSIRSAQASPFLTALLSSTSPSATAYEEAIGSRLSIPNRLASFVNYNRQSLINNHHSPATDGSATGHRRRWANIFGGSRVPSSSTSNNHELGLPTTSLRPSVSHLISYFVNNINSRIGLHNSVRISNALRDLAWKILAGFSIPTPVIYELRRMNIYGPGEQQDDGPSGNQSITIRSKRMLNRPKRSIMDRIRSQFIGEESDDDEEIESSGLFSRLADLFDRSHRPLIGRVIRLPFWLPFRRYEQGGASFMGSRDGPSDDVRQRIIRLIPNNTTTNNNHNKSKMEKSLRHRKGTNNQKEGKGDKKSTSQHRPLISVDGRNYYLDDENKLRSFN